MRTAFVLLTVLLSCTKARPDEPPCEARGTTSDCSPLPRASCEVSVAKIAGWLSVDIAASCEGEGDEWVLEHRLVSSGVVSVSQRDRPCGSVTHVDVLLSNPNLADMRAFATLSDSTQRIDCVQIAGP